MVCGRLAEFVLAPAKSRMTLGEQRRKALELLAPPIREEHPNGKAAYPGEKTALVNLGDSSPQVIAKLQVFPRR